MDLQRSRLRALLAAAARTPYYQPARTRPALPAPDSVFQVDRVEELLGRITPLSVSTFLNQPDSFLDPQAPPERPRQLRYPVAPTPRTAVLMPGFLETNQVRVFPEGLTPAVLRFQPQALAAPADLLRWAASNGVRGRVVLPRLENALVVFTGVPFGCLSEADRDLLWRAFQVPVFEQMLGFDGELLASECEAHEGLHLRQEQAIFEYAPGAGQPEVLITFLNNLRYPLLRMASGLTAQPIEGACACGWSAPRITEPRPIAAPRALAAAAR